MPEVETKTSISEFKQRLHAAEDYAFPWEKEARIDYQFYALQQWDDADLARMETKRKPALTFDRIRPIVDSVRGSEIVNRYEPRFYPRQPELESGDPQASEELDAIYKWVRQQCDVEHEESDAFGDTLICGVGCTETYVDYTEDPDGKILTERVPPFEVMVDGASKKRNFVDKRYVIRRKWLAEDQLEALFGKDRIEEVIAASKTQQPGDTFFTNFFRSTFGTDEAKDRRAYRANNSGRMYDPLADRYALWEYQYLLTTKKVRFMLPDGTSKLLSPEAADEMAQDIFEAAGGEENVGVVFDVPHREYRRAFIAGNQILKDEVLPDGFTYEFITGAEDWSKEDRRYFFGIVRAMRDPQRYANKFFSQAVHIFGASGKGAFLYEPSLFENPKEASEQLSQPDGFIPVREGMLSNVAKDKYHQLESRISFAGVESLVQHANASIPLAAGVSQSYFAGGAEDLRRTAFKSIQALREANLVTQASPFDSLKLYKKRAARLAMNFVRRYVPDQKVLRVVGTQGEPGQIVRFVRDRDIWEFDIIVEQAPVSMNQKSEVFEMIMQTNFLPQLIQLGIPIPPSLAKFFPFPTEVNAEFQQLFMMLQQALQPGGGEEGQEVQEQEA